MSRMYTRIQQKCWIQVSSRAWPRWAACILAVYSRSAEFKSVLGLDQDEPYTGRIQQKCWFEGRNMSVVSSLTIWFLRMPLWKPHGKCVSNIQWYFQTPWKPKGPRNYRFWVVWNGSENCMKPWKYQSVPILLHPWPASFHHKCHNGPRPIAGAKVHSRIPGIYLLPSIFAMHIPQKPGFSNFNPEKKVGLRCYGCIYLYVCVCVCLSVSLK